jgi:ribosomal protein S8
MGGIIPGMTIWTLPAWKVAEKICQSLLDAGFVNDFAAGLSKQQW